MAKLTTDDEEYTGCSTDCSQISFEQQQADSIHMSCVTGGDNTKDLEHIGRSPTSDQRMWWKEREQITARMRQHEKQFADVSMKSLNSINNHEVRITCLEQESKEVNNENAQDKFSQMEKEIKLLKQEQRKQQKQISALENMLELKHRLPPLDNIRPDITTTTTTATATATSYSTKSDDLSNLKRTRSEQLSESSLTEVRPKRFSFPTLLSPAPSKLTVSHTSSSIKLPPLTQKDVQRNLSLPNPLTFNSTFLRQSPQNTRSKHKPKKLVTTNKLHK